MKYPHADEVNEVLGSTLLQIRNGKGYSLADVEELTDGNVKASVLGSYERGDRTISLPRLFQLAEFYDVSPADIVGSTDPYPEHTKLRNAREKIKTVENLQEWLRLRYNNKAWLCVFDEAKQEYVSADDDLMTAVYKMLDIHPARLHVEKQRMVKDKRSAIV